MNEHRVSQLLDEARYFEDHRMWLHAVQVYQRLIHSFPGELDYRIRLGTVYLEMGNLQAAELVLLQALRHEANNPDILYSLGIACYQSGDLDRALFYMQQLAGKKLPKVHYSLGLIYWRRGELPHAERHFRLTLEYQPEHFDAALALGETCLRAGKSKEAVEAMRGAAALAQEDPSVHYSLAVALVSDEQWEGAVSTLQRVLQLATDHTDARIALAGSLMKLKRFDEAEQCLKEELLRDQRSVKALLSLGRLALMKASRKRAEEYFRQVLDIDPDHEEALEQLRYLTPNGTPSS